MKLFSTITTLLLAGSLQAQLPDVQRYHYSIELSDRSDTIRGVATIRYKMAGGGSVVQFDLSNGNSGRGMRVQSVLAAGKALSFSHNNDLLQVSLPQPPAAGVEQELVIRYGGIPADGLIISRNKYGDRTFFSDNWPNRARHWIPCNDRPIDKAAVTFEVTAPVHYQVISNGLLQEETNIGTAMKRSIWKEEIPIPTKVMVIGAARMAVGLLDSAVGVPVYGWVYPQDREKGFKDYALTKGMLEYFSALVGPYAFRKLANVQSKTIFGGMENASAIFYAETSVTGDGANEDLLAHEVAHQWFGNTASEKSFAHLWLSEGFATYCTNLYLENKYGLRKLQDRMAEDRQTVIDFARGNNIAVVNETPDLMSLLNANSYQKGGWILHMLRREVGDSVFRKILQAYYLQFRGSNADTRDFQRVAETVSGRNLEAFFQQWLYHAGLPRIDVNWKYSRGKVQLTIQQGTDRVFQFPLEIALVDGQGKQTIHQVRVDKVRDTVELPAPQKPTVVLLDPNVSLLFEGTIRE